MVKTVVDMINLYILNEPCSLTSYDTETYIRELTVALKDSDINLCVVYLHSENPYVETDAVDNIQCWYIPAPYAYISDEAHNEQYYRNVIYLLQLYIVKNGNNVFQIMHMKSKPLVDALRTNFECKIVLVLHYLDSIVSLIGNISRLRRIHLKPDEPTMEAEKLAKHFFHQERKMFSAVDKIICVSNNTFDMLKIAGYLY